MGGRATWDLVLKLECHVQEPLVPNQMTNLVISKMEQTLSQSEKAVRNQICRSYAPKHYEAYH